MIHLGNASPHNSRKSQELLEANSTSQVQHPAYSRDRPPSDFFLFRDLKEKPTDYDCRSREDLKSATAAILDKINQENLIAVFVSRIQTLKRVIQNKGRYSHK
jgi:hypothetical protein